MASRQNREEALRQANQKADAAKAAPDYLGLNETDAEQAKLPGLIVPARLRENEMQAAHTAHLHSRDPQWIGCEEVVFEDAEGGGLSILERTRWRKMMQVAGVQISGLPDEALIWSFIARQRAKWQNHFWPLQQDAQIADDEFEAGSRQATIDKAGQSLTNADGTVTGARRPYGVPSPRQDGTDRYGRDNPADPDGVATTGQEGGASGQPSPPNGPRTVRR
jgi:hypothetical protein